MAEAGAEVREVGALEAVAAREALRRRFIAREMLVVSEAEKRPPVGTGERKLRGALSGPVRGRGVSRPGVEAEAVAAAGVDSVDEAATLVRVFSRLCATAADRVGGVLEALSLLLLLLLEGVERRRSVTPCTALKASPCCTGVDACVMGGRDAVKEARIPLA